MKAQTSIVKKDLKHEMTLMASSSELSKEVSSKSTDAASEISRLQASQMMCFMMNKNYILVTYNLLIVKGTLYILSSVNGLVKASLPLDTAHGRLIPKEACV